ncbi:glycosyltransferase [Sphingobacterium sp. HJSM2_6]|uniref:glycosyltransferase n=1 Tax=Sphingobacterium sp. HJSM2_6 TaxID=3366264 RepID=UPI003BC20774
MSQKKKILYFMPENPFWRGAGNLTRCIQMLTYFEKNKEYLQVYFLSSICWTKEDEERFKQVFPSITLVIEPLKSSRKNRITYFFNDKLPKLIKQFCYGFKVNKVSPNFKKRFQNLHRKIQFDTILISYAEYGDLVTGLPHVRKIIDTHDFFTFQYLEEDRDRAWKSIDRVLYEEMSILKQFDEIWTYSIEEEYVFDQFTNKKVQLIPVTFNQHIPADNRTIKYDIIYVASDNNHNKKSIAWFTNEVLPLLNNRKVHVIGSICKHVKDHPQLIKCGRVEHIEEYYLHAKISICPMLSGTGIKIKVLESLSYGIPVVTNRRGVDGLVNKIENGCLIAQNPKDFANFMTQLLTDENFYKQIANQGINFFSLYHHPKFEKRILDSTLLVE